MNYIKHMSGFFERLEEDRRMTPYHISLYVCVFQYWNLNRFRNPFSISRMELMQLSGIGSNNTYARCMKQLDEWGYIQYSPNGNFHTGIQVSCISFDKGTDTRTSTRSDTGTETGSDMRTDTRTDTLLINNTNINKRYKQKISNFFDNGRRKINFNNNPYHVEIDKDYSEPL